LNAHFTRSGEATTLCSPLKRKGLKRKKKKPGERAPEYARLTSPHLRFARAETRGSYFLISPSTHTGERRHLAPRPVLPCLICKRQDAARLSLTGRPFPRFPNRETRAATIPHAVDAISRASPFIYARDNAEFSSVPFAPSFQIPLTFCRRRHESQLSAGCECAVTFNARLSSAEIFPPTQPLHLTKCPRRFSRGTWRCGGG